MSPRTRVRGVIITKQMVQSIFGWRATAPMGFANDPAWTYFLDDERGLLWKVDSNNIFSWSIELETWLNRAGHVAQLEHDPDYVALFEKQVQESMLYGVEELYPHL